MVKPMLATEYKEVSNGESWTEIPNTSRSFSIQNTAEVLMEYSYTDGIKKGGYLTPYTEIFGIKQSIFLRFYNVNQSGTISITRES